MTPSPELSAKLTQVKLLALDVDGVMTDGGLYYTESGEELKKFNVKDGLGIKLVLQQGIEVAILTAGTSQAAVHRAQRLGVAHVFIGVQDKLAQLEALCDKLGLGLDQVAYVGDDLIDLAAMQAVGCPITVADAMTENQAVALYITDRKGGEGAVRQVCDLLLQAIRLPADTSPKR
jgi:3-deoxy-D-manno-octulosonate 8-phosphate phosphatase (KDO 8-P phosphatase)